MSSNVLITEKLFLELVKYHCLGSEYADADYIRQALEEKLHKRIEHDQYTKSLFGDDKTQA